MSSEKFLPSPVTPENLESNTVQEARDQAIIEADEALQRKTTRQEMRSLEDKPPADLDDAEINRIGDVAITTARLAHGSEFQANWELAA